MKIGIPRALLYYRYSKFFLSFFENLGFSVVLSNYTNKKIVDDGCNLAVSEECLATKIYLGHVKDLIDNNKDLDYILVPRISSYNKNSLVCCKFNGIYDVVKSVFPDIKIIDFNIDFDNKVFMEDEFLRIGKLFKFSSSFIKNSYRRALLKQDEYLNEMFLKQEDILLKKSKKVLVVGFPYNVYDKFIGEEIINYFKKLGVDILYSGYYPFKYIDNLVKGDFYFYYNNEFIKGINYYLEHVDGVLFISSFSCSVDAIVNDYIIRMINKPCLNLVVDEARDMGGVITRIESFVDIIGKGININE